MVNRRADRQSPLRFQDIFDLDEIQTIQDTFARSTGLGSVITDPDGRHLTRPSRFTRLCRNLILASEVGVRDCRRACLDLGSMEVPGPVIRICPISGLWIGGARIRIDDQHLATWVLGQVRHEEPTAERIETIARGRGLDASEVAAALAEVPLMTSENFSRTCEALQQFASLMSRLASRNSQLARTVEEKQRADAERARLEDHLRQAAKLEAVGRLAGGVAHDFNNLLTAMIGYIELLETMVAGDAEAVEATTRIRRASDRATDLVRQLLAFARKGKERTEAVDVNEVIREVVRLLSRSIDPRIEIREKLAAKLPLVLGDATQIQNALLNLAVNARDAMPRGGRLTFATHERELDAATVAAHPNLRAPGPYVEVTVRDTGCGMDSRTRERLFEPFFTTKQPGQGTGLGLSGVYGCVESHHGSIRVDTAPGQGAAFSIMLPAADGVLQSLEEANSLEIRPIRAGRILLVDDEDSVRSLTTAVLERAGYEVISCADGVEALAAYHGLDRMPDLVVLDLVMPRLSGEDVFGRLREEDPDLKILVISGTGQHEGADRLLAAGAQGFLSKPFRPHEFVAEVDRLTGIDPYGDATDQAAV